MPSVGVLGLVVRTDCDVAVGAPASGKVDLDVSLRPGVPWPPEVEAAPARVCYTSVETDDNGAATFVVSQHGDAFYRLRYWDGSEFLVDRCGTRVWARWPPELPPGDAVTCLFGPIIGFVLHLRGTPCLHASAVAVDGRAVAFLGHSGAGKSTTAAAFIRAGCKALTDDVLALDEGSGEGPDEGRREGVAEGNREGAAEGSCGCRSEGRREGVPEGGREGLAQGEGERRFFVRPGHNLVRLCPDAVRALYGCEDALPRGDDGDVKRHLDLSAGDNRFHAAPLPLGAIYVLGDRRPALDSPVVITPLKGHAALMALVARTYMNYVLDAGLRSRALDVFSRLAARVPIRQLTVRDNANDLGAVTEAILADLRGVGNAACGL